MSKSEAELRIIMLQEIDNFLNDHGINEASKEGQLFVNLEKRLEDVVVNHLVDRDKK